MSIRIKFLPVLTAAAFCVVLATGAFAQDDKTSSASPTATPQKAGKPFKGAFGHHNKEGRAGFEGHGMGKGGTPMSMLRGLNLTDAQKGQIRSIMQSNRPDQASIDKIKTFREAKKDGTPLSPEQKAQMKAFRQQAKANSKSVHDQILNVLTPDQKTQLEQHRQQMEQRREEFRKNHPAKPAATDKPKTI